MTTKQSTIAFIFGIAGVVTSSIVMRQTDDIAFKIVVATFIFITLLSIIKAVEAIINLLKNDDADKVRPQKDTVPLPADYVEMKDLKISLPGLTPKKRVKLHEIKFVKCPISNFVPDYLTCNKIYKVIEFQNLVSVKIIDDEGDDVFVNLTSLKFQFIPWDEHGNEVEVEP